MGLVKTSFDPDALAAKIQQLGERSSRRILGVMREEAQNMADLARANAPIDDGDLEKAIEVVEDRTGVNGRIEITVQVNPTETDDHGTTISDYALRMEHGLAPYGSGAFQLGPKSQEKNSGSGQVGGRFMERAKDSRVGEMGKKVKATLPDKL